MTTLPIDLLPERTLGTPPDAEALRGRLAFGWDCFPLSEALASAEWAAYASAVPSRELVHVVLVCSFLPETPQARGEFVRASLGLSLRTAEADGPRPVARAIEPGERTQPFPSADSRVMLGINAGVLNVEVERQVTNNASGRAEWTVRGFGASQSTPMWEFRRVRRYPLVGDHTVAALVETVPDRVNVADVMLAAELEHRTLGIRRYRADLTPSQSSSITLAGPSSPTAG
ncbi:hypothetical protein [Streptomyces sp. MN13]